jgi:hypothetical protein
MSPVRVEFRPRCSIRGARALNSRLWTKPLRGNPVSIASSVCQDNCKSRRLRGIMRSLPMHKIEAGATYHQPPYPRSSRGAPDDATATNNGGIPEVLRTSGRHRKHPRPGAPPQWTAPHTLSGSCQNPLTTCHHSRRNQPLANRILGKRNAACRDALLPLRGAPILCRVNSPPASMLGLPPDDVHRALDWPDGKGKSCWWLSRVRNEAEIFCLDDVRQSFLDSPRRRLLV